MIGGKAQIARKEDPSDDTWERARDRREIKKRINSERSRDNHRQRVGKRQPILEKERRRWESGGDEHGEGS